MKNKPYEVTSYGQRVALAATLADAKRIADLDAYPCVVVERATGQEVHKSFTLSTAA